MEDYKKKYEKTEERAKNIYNSDPYNSIVRAVCEQIFPELKESEDESTRKGIIELVKQSSEILDKQNQNNMIAWLEKQGEQKLIDKIQLGKKYKCIASPRYSTFMIGEIYKPEDKFLCNLMNFCSDCFELIEDGEQKPAWSGEDSSCYDDICEILINLIYNPKSNVNKDVVQRDLNWIMSIKEKICPQNKQNCNNSIEINRRPLKKNEVKVGDIITYFRNGKKGIMLVSSFDAGIYPRCKWGITDIDGTAYGDWNPGCAEYYAATEEEKYQLYNTMPEYVKDWLKSLKERYAWKPSDEHISALNEVINFAASSLSMHWNEYIYGVLYNLRSQLKKLKGE